MTFAWLQAPFVGIHRFVLAWNWQHVPRDWVRWSKLIRAIIDIKQRNPRFGCLKFSSPYGYILPEATLAALNHKFQNACAVQNASTSLPESLSGLIERVTFFDEDSGFGVLKV